MKQTIKYKLETTIEQDKHLSNLCFYATKLYNTDNFQRRKVWEETGKIPNQYEQISKLKNNVWKQLLPSQTAQNIGFVLQQNYKSWFKLRKTHKEANPPRFRKKNMLSPRSHQSMIGGEFTIRIDSAFSIVMVMLVVFKQKTNQEN